MGSVRLFWRRGKIQGRLGEKALPCRKLYKVKYTPLKKEKREVRMTNGKWKWSENKVFSVLMLSGMIVTQAAADGVVSVAVE